MACFLRSVGQSVKRVAMVATIAETIRVNANQIDVMRQSRPFCLYGDALGLIMDLEPVGTGSEIFVQN